MNGTYDVPARVVPKHGAIPTVVAREKMSARGGGTFAPTETMFVAMLIRRAVLGNDGPNGPKWLHPGRIVARARSIHPMHGSAEVKIRQVLVAGTNF